MAKVIFLLTVQARVIFLLTEEKIFQKSTNQKQELPVAAMFVNRSGQNEQSLQRTFHRCFLPSFSSFGQAVSEEKIFRNRPIRNKNCLWLPCLLMNRDEMSNLYSGPSKDAPTKFRFIWPSGFRREDFLEINQSEIRMACGGHFVNGLGQNQHSLQRTCHRCFLPSFGSFGQAVTEKIFKNRPIRNKNCLWWPCLLMDRNKMSNLQRGPSIYASYKFHFIWLRGFRGEDFQKSTNQKQELPVAAMFVNGSDRNEHSLQRTAHRCFLPSFSSFGHAVSEEKNFLNQPIRNKSRL